MAEILDLDPKPAPTLKVQRAFIVIEIILLSIAFVGVLFKVLHWPGATFFLIVSLALYALLMFPIGLFYRGWPIKIINFTLSSVVVGILFKLMSWPQFKGYNYVGMVFGAIALAIVLFCLIKTKAIFKENKFILVRTLFLAGFCMFLGALQGKNYYKVMVDNDPIGMELYDKMHDNPNDEAARRAYIKYRSSRYKQFEASDTTHGK